MGFAIMLLLISRRSVAIVCCAALCGVFVKPTLGYQTNVTVFENCRDIAESEVLLLGVNYECDANRVCSTVHGEYEIFRRRMNMEYELWLYVANCPTGSTGRCNDNEARFVEPMPCDRFHDDPSGPWFMISNAVGHERCGEEDGTFRLTRATLKREYLDHYIRADATMSRYRIRMLFHTRSGTDAELGDMKYVRACVDMEFELVF